MAISLSVLMSRVTTLIVELESLSTQHFIDITTVPAIILDALRGFGTALRPFLPALKVAQNGYRKLTGYHHAVIAIPGTIARILNQTMRYSI